jgi:hypothetical protein
MPLPRAPVAYMSDTDLPYLAQQRPSSYLLTEPPSKNEHVELLRLHLPPVMAITDQLIKRWMDDPSPVSVALTFLEHEEDLKMVYSNWVVNLPRLLRSVREAHLPAPLSPSGTLAARSRRFINKEKRSSIAESDTETEASPVVISSIERRKSWVSTVGTRKKREPYRASRYGTGKLSIQDIVIMPSQRITRYELFLK